MMQQLQLNTYVDIYGHIIWWKPKEASFHANEEDKLFIHEISQIKPFASISFHVSCLSQSVKYRSVQARSQKLSPKHACNTLTTSYETG